jgi:hypothetical protein
MSKPKDDDRASDHAVVTGRPGEDLKALARDLGYAWPDDDEGQWRVLKLMAIMAAHWRKEYEAARRETWRDVERERIYKHQQDRYLRTVEKLKNTRKALRQFMTAQVAYVREAMAEISSSR